MGKTDKPQSKLQFELRKPPKTRDEDAHMSETDSSRPEVGFDVILYLSAMQQSITKIDGKIDALSIQMARLSERLDKHAGRLDMVERRVSEVEDGQVTTTDTQKQMKKTLTTLQTKGNIISS